MIIQNIVLHYKKFSQNYKTALAAFLASISLLILVLTYASGPPSEFPDGTIFRINKDTSVSSVANLLKEKGIIKSTLLYKAYVTLLHDGRGVQAGSYLFDQPQSSLTIAFRTAYGVSELQKIKITIFEGLNSTEIAKMVKKNVPLFDVKTFIPLAKKSEGYLFPETYYVNPDIEPQELIDLMREQFNKKITSIQSAVATSTKSLKDIIILASLIEKEANKTDDRKMISGVLWNRLSIGMPLQIDVPFYYILNKGSEALSLKDLATTSPYNTYLNKGLPPTPITNPGMDSILAALYPTKSPFLFYLADKNGVTHFAKTHDEHVLNKRKYLQ